MDLHGRPKQGYVFSGTRDRPDPFMVDTVLALVKMRARMGGMLPE